VIIEESGISDDLEVQRLGYKSELPRTFKMFASFAVAFSFISVTTGVFSTLTLGLSLAGGYITWAWLFVSAGQTVVALVFGMLASRVPLAGSSYQWVSRMAGPTLGWLQGWAFLTFVAISLLAVNYTLASTVIPPVFGYVGTADNTVIVSAAVTLLQGSILLFSTRVPEKVNNLAVITELLCTIGLSIALVIAVTVKHHLHLGNLFQPEPSHKGSFIAIGGLFHSGWWQLALLMGIYSICGFEGAADMSEETLNAERTVPHAMWVSVVLSGVVGFLFIGALVISAPDLAAAAKSATPVADILNSAFGAIVARAFLLLVCFSVFACGLIIYMDTTRIVYAMSRDERLPGWQLLRKVSPKYGTPLAAVIAVGFIDLVLLGIFGRNADSLNTIVTVTSVMPPIMYGGPCVVALFRRHRLPETKAWSLGRWELLVTVCAVLYTVLEFFVLRDSSLGTGWLYVAVAFVIGVFYLAIRHVSRGPLGELGSDARKSSDVFAGIPASIPTESGH
jgi:amino acid transporter